MGVGRDRSLYADLTTRTDPIISNWIQCQISKVNNRSEPIQRGYKVASSFITKVIVWTRISDSGRQKKNRKQKINRFRRGIFLVGRSRI